jgi:hypothetical protein
MNNFNAKVKRYKLVSKSNKVNLEIMYKKLLRDYAIAAISISQFLFPKTVTPTKVLAG